MLLRSLLALFLYAHVASAAEPERRTFGVTVGGKPAGTYVMSIQKREDGSIAMTAQADIAVRIIVVNYKYTFRGAELWKDGRLQALESSADDNGKKSSVSITGARDGAALKAGGREVFVRGHVWPTTYWQLPPEKSRGEGLVFVDADTGKIIAAKLEKVGAEDVRVAGNVIKAMRWRVSGGLKADLWYDGDDRLVRQETVEDGQKTVLELTRFERD